MTESSVPRHPSQPRKGPDGIVTNRRTFVKAVGAAVAGGALAGSAGTLAGCAPKEAAGTLNEEDPDATVQEFYAACPPDCQHHNLKATVKDGRVVCVSAGVNNESLPCARGLARLNWLNADDRLKKPLVRDGEKGENKWREVSWDEALDLFADKLRSAMEEHGNGSILHDRHAGNMNNLVGEVGTAFFSRLGGCASLTGTLCCAAVGGAMVPMWGKRFYDLRETIEDASYVIVWGNNPAITMNGYFNRFERMMDAGGTMVVIDPCRSETAAKATAWVPIRPTTDTALALGMLKVIVDENLHDAEFLLKNTTAPCLVDESGALMLLDEADKLSYAVFDTATNGLSRHDASGIAPALSTVGIEAAAGYQTVFDLTYGECAPWTPEAVEAETGVPAATVTQLARDYATAESSMIVQNMGAFMRNSYGTYAVASQLNLAVFTGNVGKPGTGVYDAGGTSNFVNLAPMFDNPKTPEDLPAIPRTAFPGQVVNGTAPNIEVFVSRIESPMTQWPNTNLVRKMLEKIPFVVVFETFMTSTALYADLVLPCAAVFETEDILNAARGHLVQLSEKAVDPPGEAHDELWIFTELAKRMGFGEDFDHDNEYFIRKALEGSPYTYEELQEKKAINAYPEGFIPFEGGAFETKSGKAELYQPSWAEKGLKPVPTYVRCPESVGGSAGLDATFPLACVQRKTHRIVNGGFGNLPLIENVGGKEAGIIMNADDAKERGIEQGDRVVVFNDRGEHRAVARVTEHLMAGVVVAENGWWEQQGGSSSAITNDAVGVLAGEHCCNESLVDVKKEA